MISAFGVDHGAISKSYLNGQWVKPAELLVHQKETGKVGGHFARSKGVSAEDMRFKRQSLHRKKKVAMTGGAYRKENYSYGPFRSKEGFMDRLRGMRGGHGYTYRLGGKGKQGRSYMRGEGTSKEYMAPTRAHEHAHAMEGRTEYRLHHQIMGSPTKMMREEARADMAPGSAGHYGEQYLKTFGSKKHGIEPRHGPPGSYGTYAAAALYNDPAKLRQTYPHLSHEGAQKGIDAYKSVQDKILNARGGKEKAIEAIRTSPRYKPKQSRLLAIKPRSKDTGPLRLRMPRRQIKMQPGSRLVMKPPSQT